MSQGRPIWMVQDRGCQYRVNLMTNTAEVLKVRRSDSRFRANTEYFQKITSAPKLKRLLKMAAAKEQAWQGAGQQQ